MCQCKNVTRVFFDELCLGQFLSGISISKPVLWKTGFFNFVDAAPIIFPENCIFLSVTQTLIIALVVLVKSMRIYGW